MGTTTLELKYDAQAKEPSYDLIEGFFNFLHGFHIPQKKKEVIPTYAFEIVSDKDGARFYLTVPTNLVPILSKRLKALYPTLEIEAVKSNPLDIMKTNSNEEQIVCSELNDYHVTKQNKNFMNELMNSMNHVGEDEVSMVQILIQPTTGKVVVVSSFILNLIKGTLMVFGMAFTNIIESFILKKKPTK